MKKSFFEILRDIFTKNIGIKVLALLLAVFSVIVINL